MRWLVLTVTVTGLCGAAQAREPLARPMEHTPSIMVGGEMERPSRANRQRAARPRASRTRRTQASRARPLVIPRPSIYETETRSINSSISHQQQQLQIQQRQQFDNNLFRQEIQRSTSSPVGGDAPGVRGAQPSSHPVLRRPAAIPLIVR